MPAVTTCSGSYPFRHRSASWKQTHRRTWRAVEERIEHQRQELVGQLERRTLGARVGFTGKLGQDVGRGRSEDAHGERGLPASVITLVISPG